VKKRKWWPWSRDAGGKSRDQPQDEQQSQEAEEQQPQEATEAKGERRIQRAESARMARPRRSNPREEGREPTREDARNLMAQAGVEESPSGDDETLPDVLLDVPTVKVDEISLEVTDLHARVALHAQLANLVNLDVGAEVDLGRVSLTIKGVEAQALLKVRLRNVYAILDRALQTIDEHPEILERLLTPLGQAIGDVGSAARETLQPDGAVGSLAKDVGGTAKEALGKDGAVTQTLGDVGSVARNVGGPGGVTDRLTGSGDQPGGQQQGQKSSGSRKRQRRGEGPPAKRSTATKAKARSRQSPKSDGSRGGAQRRGTRKPTAAAGRGKSRTGGGKKGRQA